MSLQLGHPFTNFHQDLKNGRIKLSPKVESTGHLFNNEKLSDVVFVVGKPKRDENGNEVKPVEIFGHKDIIGSSCDPLRTCFDGNWEDKDRIRIMDFDASPFLSFLRFIYTDELVIEKEHIAATLQLAHKYMVDSLFDRLFTIDNLIMIISERDWSFWELVATVTRKYRQICYEALKFHSLELKKNLLYCPLLPPSFLSEKIFPLDLLKELLSLDAQPYTERDLFDLGLSWARNTLSERGIEQTPANFRQLLDPVIRCIRFPLMDDWDLAYVLSCRVLNPAEIDELKHCHSSPLVQSSCVLNFVKYERNVKSSIFNTNPRFYIS